VSETETVAPRVRRSESFAALAAALAKAQGEIVGASKDKTNPHFKSNYADLAAVWDACRGPLSKNGLAVLQPAVADGARVTVTTILTHSSGEWVESELTMTAAQSNPQGLGSCITYARRYALAAMVGVAPEDDDGNAASHGGGAPEPNSRPASATVASPVAMPDGYDEALMDLEAVAADNFDDARKVFQGWTPEWRQYFTTVDKTKYAAFKAKGAAWDKAKQKPEAA
jgi:hypothetical protein